MGAARLSEMTPLGATNPFSWAQLAEWGRAPQDELEDGLKVGRSSMRRMRGQFDPAGAHELARWQ